jgi:hypothetical protein
MRQPGHLKTRNVPLPNLSGLDGRLNWPKGKASIGYQFPEEAAAALPVLRRLTREQEAQHVLDRKLLLVAVCALNHWSAEEIVAAYQITRAECVKPDSRACANGLGRGL